MKTITPEDEFREVRTCGDCIHLVSDYKDWYGDPHFFCLKRERARKQDELECRDFDDGCRRF